MLFRFMDSVSEIKISFNRLQLPTVGKKPSESRNLSKNIIYAFLGLTCWLWWRFLHHVRSVWRHTGWLHPWQRTVPHQEHWNDNGLSVFWRNAIPLTEALCIFYLTFFSRTLTCCAPMCLLRLDERLLASFTMSWLVLRKGACVGVGVVTEDTNMIRN